MITFPVFLHFWVGNCFFSWVIFHESFFHVISFPCSLFSSLILCIWVVLRPAGNVLLAFFLQFGLDVTLTCFMSLLELDLAPLALWFCCHWIFILSSVTCFNSVHPSQTLWGKNMWEINFWNLPYLKKASSALTVDWHCFVQAKLSCERLPSELWRHGSSVFSCPLLYRRSLIQGDSGSFVGDVLCLFPPWKFFRALFLPF